MGALCVCIGCGTGGVTPPVDTGVRTDRPAVIDTGDPRADTDRDGLCDESERMRGTDPSMVDTDGDGLLDSFEARIGTNPRTLRDPPASDRVSILEEAGSFATIEHVLEYRGAGESLTAAVLDGTAGVDGRAASDLVEPSIEAVMANPAAFVQGITGPRFVGVQGRTLLQWRLAFTARPLATTAMDGGAPVALGCRRTYEALVSVKRDGDTVVQTRRILVDVVPARDAGVSAWPMVSASGHCLPARCF